MIPAGEDSAALIRLAEKFLSLENKNFHHWRAYLESSDYETDEKKQRTCNSVILCIFV